VAVKAHIDELREFVQQVYMVDVGGSRRSIRTGPRLARVLNYLAAPEFPLDTKGTQFATRAVTSKAGTSRVSNR